MDQCDIAKQGPCGFFCLKYWLGSGCPEDCNPGKSNNLQANDIMKENIYGPGDDDYGRDKWPNSDNEKIVNVIKESTDKPKHIKPGMYAMFYSYLKDIAKEYGYNLLINGSMNRDLDLVAVPWNDHCCFTKEQLMIRDFQEYLTGRKITDQKGNFCYTVLPGNRHSYIIDLNRGDRNGEWVRFEDCQYYLDISVVQLQK